jgi:hypothetical protein
MLHPAKNAMLPSSYTITHALINAQLDILLKQVYVLNVIPLAKLALLMTLLNVHPALLHTNYGKEDALLNALLELTLLVLEHALHAVLQNAPDALEVLLALNA